ncbi:MAG: nucleoside triphosphate pyrophosphohydrolase [Chthoniobacterales bacterium]|nr:nucleoside triphosphate pyrophosphohydrolase [Chthoniobacterales bacterium]
MEPLPTDSSLTRLCEIVARLRAPDGCPWDREQTHASLRGALIEECYEVLDAIERADDSNLREELGDLLLHVVMHAQMARERAAFSFEEVAAEICAKMIRRHPHVFGDKLAGDSQEVLRQWEKIKRAEKGESSGIFDSLPASLPALLRAQNVQKKAGRNGLDWPDIEPVFEKMQEELAEVRQALADGNARAVEDEIGDILFTAVNLARKLDVDAETTLAAATNRFIKRFLAVEKELGDRKMEDTPPGELDAIWNRIKTS